MFIHCTSHIWWVKVSIMWYEFTAQCFWTFTDQTTIKTGCSATVGVTVNNVRRQSENIRRKDVPLGISSLVDCFLAVKCRTAAQSAEEKTHMPWRDATSQ